MPVTDFLPIVDVKQVKKTSRSQHSVSMHTRQCPPGFAGHGDAGPGRWSRSKMRRSRVSLSTGPTIEQLHGEMASHEAPPKQLDGRPAGLDQPGIKAIASLSSGTASMVQQTRSRTCRACVCTPPGHKTSGSPPKPRGRLAQGTRSQTFFRRQPPHRSAPESPRALHVPATFCRPRRQTSACMQCTG